MLVLKMCDQLSRPMPLSRPTTFPVGAVKVVLTSARTETCGRSRAVGLSRMDAKGVTGLLHM
jgi:hypothetical protein